MTICWVSIAIIAIIAVVMEVACNWIEKKIKGA